MKVQYIHSRDLDEMSISELKTYLRKLDNEANARINRLRKSDVLTSSTAYQTKVVQAGLPHRKFTVPRSTSRSEIYSRIINAQGFLKSDTSTVTGTRKAMKSFKKEYKKSVSDYDAKEALKAYKRYVKDYPVIKAAIESAGIHMDTKWVHHIIEISQSKKTTRTEIKEAFDYIEEMQSKTSISAINISAPPDI